MDQGRRLGELLLEGIAEVMGGVCRNDEDRGPDTGEQDGQHAAASRLPDASFPTHKDPFQLLLLQHVGDGAFHLQNLADAEEEEEEEEAEEGDE